MAILSPCHLTYIILIGTIIILILIGIVLVSVPENFQVEHFGTTQSNFNNYLEFSIAGLQLNKKNKQLLENLIGFRNWLNKNPEDKIVLTSDPHNNLGYIVDKYLRQTNNINFSDAVILKDNLNGYFSEDTEKFTMSSPSRIIQFTDWLDKDLPKRQRFDLALTASANDYNKFYIASFINEFRSSRNIPEDELKTLKEDILKYLDSNNKVAYYDLTFNTTQFDKLRTIFRKNPESSTQDKLNLYYKVYQNDPLGSEINNFIRYLNTIQVLNKINSITNKNLYDKNTAKKTFEQIVNNYPNKSDLLKKAICVQFIDIVFNDKKKEAFKPKTFN